MASIDWIECGVIPPLSRTPRLEGQQETLHPIPRSAFLRGALLSRLPMASLSLREAFSHGGHPGGNPGGSHGGNHFPPPAPSLDHRDGPPGHRPQRTPACKTADERNTARDSLPQRSIPHTDDASAATSPRVSPRGALRSLPSVEMASSPALPSGWCLHITRSSGPFSSQLPGHQQLRHPHDTELSTPGPRSRLTRPHQPRRGLPYSGFTPSWPPHHHQYSCARGPWAVSR